MSLTVEEKNQALQYATNGGTFMFLPHPHLIEAITNGHPNTEGINQDLKTFILEGKAIRLDPKMIIDYCVGKLDESNTWLLDQGDIKVEPVGISLN